MALRTAMMSSGNEFASDQSGVPCPPELKRKPQEVAFASLSPTTAPIRGQTPEALALFPKPPQSRDLTGRTILAIANFVACLCITVLAGGGFGRRGCSNICEKPAAHHLGTCGPGGIFRTQPSRSYHTLIPMTLSPWNRITP